MGIYVGENPLSVPGMSAYQEAIKGGFAGTREDFDKALKDLPDHLANETRHITAEERKNWNSKAPGGFGLGDIVAIIPANANLNDYIQTGFFGNGNTSVIRTWINTPANWPANETILEVYTLGRYAIQRMSSVTTKVSAQRSLINNVWAEWEWINPCMVTESEYEGYRTIERYKGESVFKGRLGDFEVWQYGSAVDNRKWQSTGKSVMYKIAVGAAKNIALLANSTFVVSCCDNTRRGVAIVQVEGSVIRSITPIVPIDGWALEAGSGLTVNVIEKDNRFDLIVYIKML